MSRTEADVKVLRRLREGGQSYGVMAEQRIEDAEKRRVDGEQLRKKAEQFVEDLQPGHYRVGLSDPLTGEVKYSTVVYLGKVDGKLVVNDNDGCGRYNVNPVTLYERIMMGQR